jgi:programmed cell death protein 5
MSSSQPSQPNDEEIRRREAEAATMRQRVLQVVLDPQARQRLMNIRLVKADLAQTVENYLISAASSGRISRPLTDDELKQLLLRIQQPKKEFRFERR